MGVMKDFDRRIRQGGDDAIAAVGELMPRWIPVGERLPEAGQECLVFSEHIDCDFCMFPALWTGEFWETSGLQYGRQFLPYWMPLPAPPEVTP